MEGEDVSSISPSLLLFYAVHGAKRDDNGHDTTAWKSKKAFIGCYLKAFWRLHISLTLNVIPPAASLPC